MNALPSPSHGLRAMDTRDLDAVLSIEAAAYAFPWSRGNFVDSLAAGHPAQVLCGESGRIIGYFVAMVGAQEMHLLNLTVAPPAQGQGNARRMLEALVALSRCHRAGLLWLEVRESNTRARAVYEHFGFEEMGVRRRYYPGPFGHREDAVVMQLELVAGAGADAHGGDHAMD